jgi:hypothetical protein
MIFKQRDRSTPESSPERRPVGEPGARGLRAALIFGVVAATIEMAVLLWVANC